MGEPLREVVSRLRTKVERHEGLRCRTVLLEEKGELHIGIYCSPMGKRHRAARLTIDRCVSRSRRLRHYAVYLYLNPQQAGRACTMFQKEPQKMGWRPVTKQLPHQELVA